MREERMKKKIFIVWCHREGTTGYGPHPDTHYVEGYFAYECEAEAFIKKKNQALMDETIGWDPEQDESYSYEMVKQIITNPGPN